MLHAKMTALQLSDYLNISLRQAQSLADSANLDWKTQYPVLGHARTVYSTHGFARWLKVHRPSMFTHYRMRTYRLAKERRNIPNRQTVELLDSLFSNRRPTEVQPPRRPPHPPRTSKPIERRFRQCLLALTVPCGVLLGAFSWWMLESGLGI